MTHDTEPQKSHIPETVRIVNQLIDTFREILRVRQAKLDVQSSQAGTKETNQQPPEEPVAR